MSILDSVISNTVSGPRVINEQHDAGQIRVDESAITSTIRSRNGNGGWDAAEYGITREQAAQMFAEANTPEERARVRQEIQQRALRRANLTSVGGKVALVAADNDDIWHGLGTVVSGAMTADQLFELAPQLDVRYDKVPAGSVIDGQFVEVKGKWHVRLTDTEGNQSLLPETELGRRYTLIQPRESVKFLDDCLGNAGLNFETAGLCNDGRQLFITARQPQGFEPVRGDEVYAYMGLIDYFDGTTSAKWFACSKRMVCQNTARLAMREGMPYASFRHTASISEKMQRSADAFRLSTEQFRAFQAHAEAMARVNVSPQHYANDVLDCVMDITAADARKGASALAAALDVTEAERRLEEASFARKIAKRGSVLDDILNRYESETNTAPGTLWSAYNAVTEHANHGIKMRGENKPEKRIASVLEGNGAEINDAAMNQALAVMA